MRSIGNKIICKPDMNHKRIRKLTEDVEIQIETQWNDNRRESNPQLAEVVAIPGEFVTGYKKEKFEIEVEPGDQVFTHHFKFIDHSLGKEGHFTHKGDELYPVDYREVFFAIRNSQIIPLCDFVILEPIIEEELKSEFLVIPDGFKQPSEKKAKVLHVSKYTKENFPEVKEGDVVYLIDKNARYPLEYNNKKYYRARAHELIGVEVNG